jgi:thiosulfate/3-mercaptopyruvate sulfurtransferase
MNYTILISTKDLAQHLDDPDWAIIDCRFWLDDTEKGRRDYLESHIPGALYAHVDEDLSSPIIPGVTGRHPLPNVDEFSAKLGSWGIGPDVQVVAYDDRGGAIAARLWWLLHWLGHQQVAVLNGGWTRWVMEGRPVSADIASNPERIFVPRLRPELVVSTAQVEALREDPAFRLLDSRAPERYRGEEEPIDPVAGHIPGAISAPFAENLDDSENFLPRETLRERFRALMGDVPAERTVFYCGSGVTGSHNVLALAHAGLGEARLYAGSWSEWITDSERPVGRVG